MLTRFRQTLQARDAERGSVRFAPQPRRGAVDPDPAAPTDPATTRSGRPGPRRLLGWTANVLAVLVVVVVLIFPNDLRRFSAGSFVRLPVEALLAVPLLVVTPARWRRLGAALLGTGLGLLAVLKLFDLGFNASLARPFDPVLDWALVGDGAEFLSDALGGVGTAAALTGAVLLSVLVLVLCTAATVRAARLVLDHHTRALRVTAALGVLWLVLAGLGVRLVPGATVASRDAASLGVHRVQQIAAGLADQKAFAREVAADSFRGVPADRLLTALRGKDVVVTFVESYGRSAIEDPAIAPGVTSVLDAGTARLRKAGLEARSAFLTSSTAGGGSWLAHSTLLSGLWINNQQRYHNLVASDRLTLGGAFRRAGWETVAFVPGVTRAWPEGTFFGNQKVYAAADMGYRGPRFGWATMPDQFTLAALDRLVLGRPGHAPVMVEMPLLSSHAPWAPLPTTVPWEQLGDGSIFTGVEAQARRPGDVWSDPAQVKAEYGRSVQYSWDTLVSYLERTRNRNLVLVVLGDHQPAPVVTGDGAGRDVPVTVIANDRTVLDRISGWGWQEGLHPSPSAPVWPMNTFRDRFLTAYGPSTAQPGATATATAAAAPAAGAPPSVAGR